MMRNGHYFFSILASNGEIVFRSEEYLSEVECLKAIDYVKIAAQSDSNFERITHPNNDYSFLVKSSTGKLLGKSERYASMTGRENGIAAVKRAVKNTNDGILVAV